MTLWPRLGPKQSPPARATGFRKPPQPDLSHSRTLADWPLPATAMISSLVMGWPLSAPPMVSMSLISSASVSPKYFSQLGLVRIQCPLMAAV